MKTRPASVLMEAVIVFPVLLTVVFAVIQFANVMMVQQLVEYAAYCGARSTLTCNALLEADDAAKNAAMRVLAPVSLSKEDDDRETGPHVYPGWGKLKGTKDLSKEVSVTLEPSPLMASALKYVTCKVEFDYPLLVPIPGYRTTNGVIRLTGKAALPLRYSTLKYPYSL